MKLGAEKLERKVWARSILELVPLETPYPQPFFGRV